MQEPENKLRELVSEIQTKAESLKRDSPVEYKRILTELAATLETFNRELKSTLSS